MTAGSRPWIECRPGTTHVAVTPEVREPTLVSLVMEGATGVNRVRVPAFGQSTYRIDSPVACRVAAEGGLLEKLQRPARRPNARFEAHAKLDLAGGLSITPVAYGVDPDSEKDFMREVRAMRWLRLYPVADESGLAGSCAQRRHVAPPDPVAVIVHLHYRELWPEMADFVRSVPGSPDIFVSVTADDQAGDAAIRAAFPDAVIRRFENRGYDIAPFLAWLNEGAFDGYAAVCKVHGKKSVRLDGTDSLIGRLWRRAALHALLGSSEVVDGVLARLASEPRLGIIGPSRLHIRQDGPGRFLAMRRNRQQMVALAGRMGVPWYRVPLDYFAGSMFWARPEALAPLRALSLAPRDFPVPGVRRDGTLGHVIERLFNVAVVNAGYEVGDVGRPAEDIRQAA